MNSKFMYEALKEAKVAAKEGEVPVGAVIVRNGEIISKAHNMREQKQNALSHAEIEAINIACEKLGSWRLDDCELYVTLEPCVMCLGACYNARISNLYFGAFDLSGAGCIHLAEHIGNTLNHHLNIQGGICEKDCSQILTDYFKSKRQ